MPSAVPRRERNPGLLLSTAFAIEQLNAQTTNLSTHDQRCQRATSVADIAEGMDVTQAHKVMRSTFWALEVIERRAGASDIVLEQVMRRPCLSNWGEHR